jgi:hypothetical protein
MFPKLIRLQLLGCLCHDCEENGVPVQRCFWYD